MLKSMNLQEVNLSVFTSRQASGNSLRENIQDFESLSETIQFLRFAKTHRSGARYRLVLDTRPNLTRTTVLDKSSHYAENTRFLE